MLWARAYPNFGKRNVSNVTGSARQIHVCLHFFEWAITMIQRLAAATLAIASVALAAAPSPAARPVCAATGVGAVALFIIL
jgi:hypothetical protein